MTFSSNLGAKSFEIDKYIFVFSTIFYFEFIDE
jgi:hypothetical protein